MPFSAGALVVLLAACWLLAAQPPAPGVPAVRRGIIPAPADPRPEPIVTSAGLTHPERLTYDVDWRTIRAGTVVVDSQKTRTEMKIESGGIVSSLYKIHDTYTADYDDPFCATSSLMDSQEGKRHRETAVTYDRTLHRATLIERDLLKNVVMHSDEIDVPNCAHEVMGAFLQLRSMNLEPGQSTQIAMSDGRRSAPVKIEAQEREEVKTPAGSFQTIRYEPSMLNGVVYTRKGRVAIWLSDDERHLPVQIRLRMQFPIGTVTLQLQKEESPDSK